MKIKPIKTRVLHPPQDDLLAALKASIKTLPEQSVVAITSKVVSIWEGRCVAKDAYANKDDLAITEADFYLPRNATPHRRSMVTLKNNMLISSAGVDASNGDGFYIMWPKNPKRSATVLWQWLRKTYNVKNIGVIITDSYSPPLRRGIMGISLAHYGFEPLKDYRGTKDLFGRMLTMSATNMPDSLAAAAVLAMGEGAESTPVCIIENVPGIQFTAKPVRHHKPFSSFETKFSEDFYYPIFKAVTWKKGGGK